MKKFNRPVEIVPGVGSDDLPLNHFSTENFSRLPVVRNLDWRVDTAGNPIRRGLKDAIGFVAAFGHTRGQEAWERCAFCKTGKGPWASCIVISDPVNPDAKYNGYCSNFPVATSDDEDEFPNIRQPDDDNDPTYELTTAVASSLLYNNESDDDLPLLRGLGTDTVQNSTLSSGKCPKAAGTLEKNKRASSKFHVPPQREILPKPRVIKQELQGGCFEGTRGNVSTVPTSQSPAITRLPLNIKKPSSSVALPRREVAVPFPLGADAFDNLELLKHAEKDMLGHIEKIRKRITMLEAQQMEHHDPWAYV
ncbi:DUF3716 domain-containing protein [Aspergillus candidus]|uniref:Uncharacterized protein n=1 Tax=Aspergillus candidus TaxID=41067 RepID=A0A2I2FIV7_ASPCN|nr:hypothetical protein BDW47DRAFT_123576 [Aspergillus candidus]PLB40562.1 hypothetical protein BDW47DRAFT_123576 [Aspergillus candidus]